MSQNQVLEIVTNKIIQLMEQGELPWKSYTPAQGKRPKNLSSGKSYNGVNSMLLGLAAREYGSNYWVTFKQAKELGGNVKIGSKGLPVLFASKIEKDNGDDFFCYKYFTVFNVTQCDGLQAPESELITSTDIQGIAACDSIVNNMPQRPEIKHQESSLAFYSVTSDSVTMPLKVTCSSEEYYSILFHELGHSTGAKSRLSRDSLSKIQGFSKHDYSKEELVAEMTSAYLCAHAGISQATITNQAAYIQAWLKVLKNDRKMLVQACSQAQKAYDFILNVKE